MAAGLTVAADKLDALAEFLDERLAAAVTRARDDRALLIDAVLAPAGVNPDFVAAIEAGGPYGAGWPAPLVVAGPMRVVKADIVGNGHRSRRSPSARLKAILDRPYWALRAIGGFGSRAGPRSMTGAAALPLNCIWKTRPGLIERRGRFSCHKGVDRCNLPP
jgi:single-stranded-DNA-specific exonuclease